MAAAEKEEESEQVRACSLTSMEAKKMEPSIRSYGMRVYKTLGRDSLNCETIARLNEFESEMSAWNRNLDERVEEEGEADG